MTRHDPPLGETISHGTLRADHLIAAFLPLLQRLDPATADQVGDAENDERVLSFIRIDASSWNPIPSDLQESAQELADWLQDRLNDCAPDGYHFGPHEGDGSDFGFWPDDDGDVSAWPAHDLAPCVRDGEHHATRRHPLAECPTYGNEE